MNTEYRPSVRGVLSSILAIFCFVLSTAVIGNAQIFTTLASFNLTNGDSPGYGSLVQGTDGNLYGTTIWGGTASNCTYIYGCGTVFKITPEGALTTLHSFCSLPNCADGDGPYAGLVLAQNGNFYGVTTGGGVGTFCSCGTVFELTPTGNLTTIHSFGSTEYDGHNPVGGLMQASDGNLYGTTNLGGTSPAGTLFKIAPSGKLTTLYNFYDSYQDSFPIFALVQATNGNLYSGVGYDIVEFSPSELTILYNFVSGFPTGSLIQANDGNFYGTTTDTVFELTPSGALTTFYSCYLPPCHYGYYPFAGVIQATDGNFYGTTEMGGATCPGTQNGCGTIFELSASGQMSTLHLFPPNGGNSPWAGLVQATNGDFYGTTPGTSSNYGTVFRMILGMGPFVKTTPTAARTGARIMLLGTKLRGATSVTFNGTAASFKVVSETEITAFVPVGATTGTVEVTTPDGILTSNVPFQIL